MSIVSQKTVTVKEVYEAIMIDGYEHLRDEWIVLKRKGDNIVATGGCLLGQAALNLEVVPDTDWLVQSIKQTSPLSIAWANDEPEELWDEETGEYYDNPDYVGDDIAIFDLLGELNKIGTPYNHTYDDEGRPIGGQQLGDLIVNLNDSRNVNFDDSKGAEPRYSYETLKRLLKQVMEPYFSETLTVTEFNFNDAETLNV